MSPFGHLTTALLVRRVLGPRWASALDLPSVVAGSTLPDLDLLLLPFAKREKVHRTFSHSLFFLFLSAYVLQPWFSFWGIVFGGMTHLLVDNVWGGDPPGVAWGFPFDSRRRQLGFELGMRSSTLAGRNRARKVELAVILVELLTCGVCELWRKCNPRLE